MYEGFHGHCFPTLHSQPSPEQSKYGPDGSLDPLPRPPSDLFNPPGSRENVRTNELHQAQKYQYQHYGYDDSYHFHQCPHNSFFG